MNGLIIHVIGIFPATYTSVKFHRIIMNVHDTCTFFLNIKRFMTFLYAITEMRFQLGGLHNTIFYVIVIYTVLYLFTLTNTESLAIQSNDTQSMSLQSSAIPYNTNNSTFYPAMAIFVSSEPVGFGIYDKDSLSIFSPGETIITYIEPVGFAYKNITDINGKPLYSINFGASFTISSPDGTMLGGQENVPIGGIVSHHMNKEVFIPYSITQSIPFPAGDYVVTYKITDKNSDKSFNFEKNITIS